ncbi:MAG: hypothetical protein RLZZ11_780 [Cyanobacteriota bacterium]
MGMGCVAPIAHLEAAADVPQLGVHWIDQFGGQIFSHLIGTGADRRGSLGEGAQQLGPLLHQGGALDRLQSGALKRCSTR